MKNEKWKKEVDKNAIHRNNVKRKKITVLSKTNLKSNSNLRIQK